jgi:hypothetical protein
MLFPGAGRAAVRLRQTGRDRVGHPLSLVVAAAVQNGEEVRVADQRRLAAQRRLGCRLDELALVEPRFIALS